MRSILTLVIIALVTASLCAECLLSTSNPEIYKTFSTLCFLWLFSVASFLIFLLLLAPRLWQSLFGRLTIIFGLACLFTILAVDLTLLNELGLFSFEVFRNLPIDLFADQSSQEIVAYVVQNFTTNIFLIAISAIIIPSWIILRAKWRFKLSALTAGISAFIFIAVILSELGGAFPKSVQELLTDDYVEASPLYASDRSKSFQLRSSWLYLPHTIVLVINESAGAFLRSSDDKGISLEQRLANISGGSEEWSTAENAVTNSNCTEVSIPSLLTGSGSHESIAKLHEMPFVFDMAKARGYQTIFYTSATLRWSNLNLFFSSAKIDETFSAENSGGFPLVNDLGIDDAIPMSKLSDYILRAEGPQFIVVYTNALHTPFQTKSRIPIPDQLSDRRSRALHLIEAEHQIIFDALRISGRYDDAMIILIGDHGERLDDPRAPKTFVPRLENYSEPVLRPIFMIKPPKKLPEKNIVILKRNQGALVANLDIAPTIADMLGISLVGNLSYIGHSLLNPISASRISIATSTNEWRAWTRTAVAVSKGRRRLVCDSFELCKYYDAKSDDSALSFKENKEEARELMSEALSLPIIKQNIARIYRTHTSHN